MKKEALECCWHREGLSWLGLRSHDWNCSQWTKDDKGVATTYSRYHSIAICVEDLAFDE